MFNLNEKYFPISERCGRNHQNKFLFTSPKETFSPWELNEPNLRNHAKRVTFKKEDLLFSSLADFLSMGKIAARNSASIQLLKYLFKMKMFVVMHSPDTLLSLVLYDKLISIILSAIR